MLDALLAKFDAEPLFSTPFAELFKMHLHLTDLFYCCISSSENSAFDIGGPYLLNEELSWHLARWHFQYLGGIQHHHRVELALPADPST